MNLTSLRRMRVITAPAMIITKPRAASGTRTGTMFSAAGRIKPGAITERTIQKYLDEPDLPDVDLFLRSSGEQRLSNFLLWQSAYAEFVFMDTLWPDVDRRTLWAAVEEYARRDRRYGGAVDAAKPVGAAAESPATP